jgi:hypothetical protein
MNNLENLDLTEKDFDLLVQGLDALPEKGAAGEIMVGLLGAMMSKGDDEAKMKFESDREKERKQKEGERLLLTEDIRILQGKLLMLKRYFMENKLLGDAREIINR